MLLKAGVDISRLERNTRRAMGIVGGIYKSYDQEMVVTETYGGNHGEGSLHYANQAFDIRYGNSYKNEIRRDMKDRLGREFDIVEELTHIHIEYDPK